MNTVMKNDKRQPHSSSGQVLRQHLERCNRLTSREDAFRILKLKVLEQALRDALAIANLNVHRRLLHNRVRPYASQVVIEEHLALEQWLKFEDLSNTSLNCRDLCQETGGDFKKFRDELLSILNDNQGRSA